MLKRTVVIALFLLGVVTMLAGVVEAGCMTLSGGTRYCAAWITGSEICQVNIQGQIDQDLPTVRCTASGIEGTSFCVNPASNSRKASGKAFHLTVPLTQSADVQTCSKKTGICSAAIELDPNPETTPGLCINENWQFVTLTAASFTGKVEVCPRGIANPEAGSDVATQCVGGDAPLTLVENCTVDLTGYRPGDNRTYTCTCDPLLTTPGGCPQP